MKLAGVAQDESGTEGRDGTHQLHIYVTPICQGAVNVRGTKSVNPRPLCRSVVTGIRYGFYLFTQTCVN